MSKFIEYLEKVAGNEKVTCDNIGLIKNRLNLEDAIRHTGFSKTYTSHMIDLLTGNLSDEQERMISYLLAKGVKNEPVEVLSMASECRVPFYSVHTYISLELMEYLGEIQRKFKYVKFKKVNFILVNVENMQKHYGYL